MCGVRGVGVRLCSLPAPSQGDEGLKNAGLEGVCCAERFVQQGSGADALQLTLRFSFQARLTASVRLLKPT